MYELIPIVVGAAGGLAVAGLHRWRARSHAIVPLSIIVGIAAAVLSGEIGESWAFVLWDTAQALAAAVLATVIATRWTSQREDSAEPGRLGNAER